MKEVELDARIYIVGAGISGLIAAQNLELHGYSPVILEASDQAGGRVSTDVIEGYQLDRGFQVLLEAYPMAQKYLNYEELDLQPLKSGAQIFRGDTSTSFGDPLRDRGFLFSTLFSDIGTLRDKRKVYQLSRMLKSKSLDEIFAEEEYSTKDYLEAYGFSSMIINDFFRPFFSGIFLEPNLETSSRMFEYVYKLFGEGRAMIPKKGIGAIPEQLLGNLKSTTIRYNTKVAEVKNGVISFDNGEKIESDFTIIATDPKSVLSNFSSTLKWKRCDNLYFTTPKRAIPDPIIGLNANDNALINNVFFTSSVDVESKGKDELLSVTVVRSHELSQEALISAVHLELKKHFNIENATFLKHYAIEQALPNLQNIQYQGDETESLLSEKIALAGDSQLNGSLNAAMLSGEAAAHITHRSLAKSLLTLA